MYWWIDLLSISLNHIRKNVGENVALVVIRFWVNRILASPSAQSTTSKAVAKLALII